MRSRVPGRLEVVRIGALAAIACGLLLAALPGRSLCLLPGVCNSVGATRDTTPAELVSALPADLPYAMEPLPGVVTSGQPLERDFAALRRAGIRTIVDLRFPFEPRGYDEARAVRAAGLEYVNLPFLRNALGPAEIDSFRAVMRQPARRPLLVHCTAANRVGGVLLPWLILDEGQPEAAAVRLAARVGLRSPELLEAALRYVRAARARPV